MARLDFICRIIMGASPDSSTYNDKMEGLPFYQGNADFGEKHPTPRVWCNAPTKIAEKDDVLISVRAPIGALNIATEQCCIGRGLAALAVNAEICDTAYLWYGISSKVDELNAKGTGSTFKAISRKALEETDIPLPDLPTQRRIAATLDKVSEGITVCRQMLADLDTLVKARFVEMFVGKGYTEKTVHDVLNAGFWLMPATPKYVENGSVPYITSKNLKNRQIDFDNVKYITEEAFESISANRPTNVGDILISMIGTLGQTAVISDNRKFYGQNLYLLRLNNRIINTDYFCEFFNSDEVQHILQGKCNQSTQAYLKANHVEDLVLPVPSMEEQERFATFVKQIDKSKFVVQQQLAELETLKKSLMQEYFNH